MTVTVNLPKNVEEAYKVAARTKGVSVDTLVADVLVSHAPMPESSRHPELIEVNGVPVLRTGYPLDPAVIEETIDVVRRERGSSVLGRF